MDEFKKVSHININEERCEVSSSMFPKLVPRLALEFCCVVGSSLVATAGGNQAVQS